MPLNNHFPAQFLSRRGLSKNNSILFTNLCYNTCAMCRVGVVPGKEKQKNYAGASPENRRFRAETGTYGCLLCYGLLTDRTMHTAKNKGHMPAAGSCEKAHVFACFKNCRIYLFLILLYILLYLLSRHKASTIFAKTCTFLRTLCIVSTTNNLKKTSIMLKAFEK